MTIYVLIIRDDWTVESDCCKRYEQFVSGTYSTLEKAEAARQWVLLNTDAYDVQISRQRLDQANDDINF